MKKNTRYIGRVVNTTNTPISVYAEDGTILYLEANSAFTGPRADVLFITEGIQREDTVIALYAGKGRGGVDIWTLHDKDGTRVYPRRR